MSSPPRRRLLLVEDDRMVRETITLMLDDHYDVATAISVQSAVTFLASPEATSIAGIMLDCLLPDGKASEVLTHANRRSIPVVLISGDPRQAETVDPQTPFLSKPFTYASLLSVLNSALR